MQELFVAAVLYHSELIDDCETFIGLSDAKCKEMKINLLDQAQDLLTGEKKVVYHFMIICRKVDNLLDWMKKRLDGQKYFNFTVENTVTIAKDLIIKAIGDHRQ